MVREWKRGHRGKGGREFTSQPKRLEEKGHMKQTFRQKNQVAIKVRILKGVVDRHTSCPGGHEGKVQNKKQKKKKRKIVLEEI